MENILRNHIDQVHTTEMGLQRVSKNLKLGTEDPLSYCKEKILDPNAYIYQKGKNWYVEIDSIRITVNAHSYTIITAHMI